MANVDLSDLSEITIQPDGRVFVFGITKPLLEIIESLPTKDAKVKQRRDYLRKLAGKKSVLHAHRKAEV